MDKYEISLWEDYQDSTVVNNQTVTFLNERKLCVIGADTMVSQARALEPKLVENINGTHTFTFKMFMKYVDNETGETYDNPFLHLLVNERKVKVYWKDTWYDLVIKRCQEDSSGKSIIYTCTDLFINELSKNGFELNFTTDLENNIGTVEDLATATLDGTTWAYDSSSDQIYQKNEEPVYEVTTAASFSAFLQKGGEEDATEVIGASSNILVFYSSISSTLEKFEDGARASVITDIQFLYVPDGYAREVNNLLVTNGNCYLVNEVTCTHDSNMNSITVTLDSNEIFTIYVGQGVSENYRAERFIKSPLTEFDNVVNRYVTVCKETSTDKKVYLIENTEYTDPLAVVNLIANPTQYKNTNGWLPIGNEDITWKIYPTFSSNTQLDSYVAKSYLGISTPSGGNAIVYNTGLTSNNSYLIPTDNEIRRGNIGGFQLGEKYIFRFKAVNDNDGEPDVGAWISNGDNLDCEIKNLIVLNDVQYNYQVQRRDQAARDWNSCVNGNVNYLNRPVISGDQMRDIYPDFDGDYATTYSQTVTIGDNNLFTFSITPILDNGQILNQSELDEYVRGIQGSSVADILSSDASAFNIIINCVAGDFNETYWELLENKLIPYKEIHLDAWLKINESSTGYASATDFFTCINKQYYPDTNWVEYTLQCTIACSADEIKNLGIFIKLKNSASYWFEDVQFFKYIEGITSYDEGAQKQRMNPGEINLQSIAVKTYKYFYADHPNIEDAKQLTYIYAGEQESENYPIQYNKYEKLATINVKESNRFNILQTIAETFKCWVRFRIEHEANGKIKFINGIPQKFVTFKAEVGDDEKKLCFEYGIDLKTISRTIDSNSIATKVIVLENSNEFAQDGFCTITRSNENYSKSNFILNFDYYTQQGLLNKDQLSKDLYGTSTDDIGYYYHLRWYNRDYDGLSDELITKKMDQIKQNSQLTTYRQYYISASDKLNNIKSDICKLASVDTWEDAQTYVQNHYKNTKVQSLMNSYAEVNNQINYYNQLIVQAQTALLILNDYISNLNSQIEDILDNIDALNDKFNTKYGVYIQEGTWQDESYIDDDKYYLDATSVSYTSSRPQITYSISVLRLSGLEEFSSKVFKVGDICYMIDREYFGYSNLETKTPYKEKILVSEITSNFDNPEKDTIQVRNYKTRFDDLFQRIAAATQSLQYSEGEYNRAAGAVNTNRTLSFSLLQDTFDANSNLVLNSSNQDVTWDGTGITVTNKLNSADKTKIIAGGIFVTNDGGETWKNAVRGDGISTELLTAGRIDTSQIYVYDGNHPAFRWDSDGLTAYMYDSHGTNFGKFVRHDKYGLYGYDNGIAYPSEALASRPSEWDKDFIPYSESSIWDDDNTKFALTWKGFMLRTGASGARVEIKSGDGEENPTIIAAYDTNELETFSLKQSGDAYFKGEIAATSGYFIGELRAATGSFTGSINVNDNFIVNSSGNVTMNGGITLAGPITWSSTSKPWGDEGYLTDETIAKSIANGSYTNPGETFIDGKTIKSPTIEGGIITGGIFKATGIGSASANSAAYYIYDGINLRGWISYDNTGAGSSWETQQRVFYKTVDNVALKIESGGGLSISAGVNKAGTIYLESNVQLLNRLVLSNAAGGYNYGSSLPSDASSVEGQFFFKI